jgi:hypothetical protein
VSIKASLETLARTMSIGLLALAVVSLGETTITEAKATTQQPVIETETKVSDLLTPTRKQLEKADRVSRSRNFDPRKTKAPKEVGARGVWVKYILKEAGFEGTHLKQAWAIVMKESTGRPTAYNGNEATGDKSYGIFQINMIDNLGVDRRAKFKLSSNKELFNPLKNAKIAYHMSNGGKNWSAWNIDSTGYNGGSDRAKYLEWLAQYPKG